MPDAAITTDIIVGFPGETDDDFEQTLYAVSHARFASAYTFQYSKRPGTPAADLPDQVGPDVVRERYERLVALVDDIAWAENRSQVGKELEVLVSTGEGRKDDATHRLSGRARDNRLVHIAPCDAQPGDFVTTTVTRAAPHHLIADDPANDIRHRSRVSSESVLIGMPALP
jgi:tRNA-2-methylthio-N6-dimethylallyladenosine synthase